MITKILSAALVSAALAVAPAVGSAATLATAPIAIDNVQLYSSSDDTPDTPSLRVTYTNNGPVAASDVVFVLVNNGQIVDSYEDSGTFSSGVAIQDTFVGPSPDNGAQLAVDYARFADGSVWINPAVAGLAPAPAVTYPVEPRQITR
jgi:hypothetical protein